MLTPTGKRNNMIHSRVKLAISPLTPALSKLLPLSHLLPAQMTLPLISPNQLIQINRFNPAGTLTLLPKLRHRPSIFRHLNRGLAHKLAPYPIFRVPTPMPFKFLIGSAGV